jgi:hypothetical protein
MTNLAWLQQWYLSNCDGDWEHQYGVHVNTLDNPGWSVKINLLGTRWESLETSPIHREASEADWMHCSINKKEFNGHGGPENLEELLQVFRSLVEEAGK